VLDSSLYVDNICYTTLLAGEARRMPREDIETPTRNFFVCRRVWEGILPWIANCMLENRACVKHEMASTMDPSLIK